MVWVWHYSGKIPAFYDVLFIMTISSNFATFFLPNRYVDKPEPEPVAERSPCLEIGVANTEAALTYVALNKMGVY